MNDKKKKNLNFIANFFVTLIVIILIFKGTSFAEIFKKEKPIEINYINIQRGTYDLCGFISGEVVGNISIKYSEQEDSLITEIDANSYSGIRPNLNVTFSFIDIKEKRSFSKWIIKSEEVYVSNSDSHFFIVNVPLDSFYLPEKPKKKGKKYFLFCETDQRTYEYINRQSYNYEASNYILVNMYLCKYAAFIVQD